MSLGFSLRFGPRHPRAMVLPSTGTVGDEVRRSAFQCPTRDSCSVMEPSIAIVAVAASGEGNTLAPHLASCDHNPPLVSRPRRTGPTATIQGTSPADVIDFDALQRSERSSAVGLGQLVAIVASCHVVAHGTRWCIRHSCVIRGRSVAPRGGCLAQSGEVRSVVAAGVAREQYRERVDDRRSVAHLFDVGPSLRSPTPADGGGRRRRSCSRTRAGSGGPRIEELPQDPVERERTRCWPKGCR